MYSVTFRPFTSLEIFVITLYYDQPVQEATTHYLSRGGGGGGGGGGLGGPYSHMALYYSNDPHSLHS